MQVFLIRGHPSQPKGNMRLAGAAGLVLLRRLHAGFIFAPSFSSQLLSVENTPAMVHLFCAAFFRSALQYS